MESGGATCRGGAQGKHQVGKLHFQLHLIVHVMRPHTVALLYFSARPSCGPWHSFSVGLDPY